MSTARSSWKRFEKDCANDINGVRIFFSGSLGRYMNMFDGDAVNDFLIVECKYSGTVSKTKGAYIRFQKEWLTKLEAEAKKNNKIPVLAFRYKRINVKACFIKKDLWKQFGFHESLPGFQQIPYKANKKTFNIFASDMDLGFNWTYNGNWLVIPWARFLEYAGRTGLLVGTETKKKFGVEDSKI